MSHPPIPESMVTGIILAGGKSSRFGSNKALFEYQGKKLVEYSIQTLKPLCEKILISTNQPEKFAFTGLQTVRDTYPDCGPIGGIHACLQQSESEHHLITGCDLPWLDTRLFAHILQCSPGFQVVIPSHKGLKETMTCYYNKTSTETLEKALQEKQYKILDAIASLKILYPVVDELDFYTEKLFANINYREDIERG